MGIADLIAVAVGTLAIEVMVVYGGSERPRLPWRRARRDGAQEMVGHRPGSPKGV